MIIRRAIKFVHRYHPRSCTASTGDSSSAATAISPCTVTWREVPLGERDSVDFSPQRSDAYHVGNTGTGDTLCGLTSTPCVAQGKALRDLADDLLLPRDFCPACYNKLQPGSVTGGGW